MNVEKLNYYKKENDWPIASALINDEYHITTDLRKINGNNVAIFSDVTKYDERKQSVKGLIDNGTYQPVEVDINNTTINYYIWVWFDFKNKEI